VITIAHKLDLPRCYDASAYAQSMQLCDELSINNPEQQQALIAMKRYIIDLAKAQGDRLRCDIDFDGKVFDVQREYEENFLEASRSLKQLFQLSQLVPRHFTKSS
jgi:hypothetical protein